MKWKSCARPVLCVNGRESDRKVMFYCRQFCWSYESAFCHWQAGFNPFLYMFRVFRTKTSFVWLHTRIISIMLKCSESVHLNGIRKVEYSVYLMMKNMKSILFFILLNFYLSFRLWLLFSIFFDDSFLPFFFLFQRKLASNCTRTFSIECVK